MEITIVADARAVAEHAAERIARVVRARGGGQQGAPGQRGAVLGVATGSSPLGTYEVLADMVRDGALDTSGVSAFALDEYVGLDPAHPESYRSVIQRTVTDPLGLDPARVHVPDGSAADLTAASDAYERMIREAGGIDLQLLGIGANGHIGFNEPTSSFASRTRVKTLAPQTRLDNARFFDSVDQVPVRCLTQGLATILDARQLLLVAHGEGKARAVAQMIEGPLASFCPASALQLHRDAVVVIDRAAASRLQLVDYYEYVQASSAEAKE